MAQWGTWQRFQSAIRFTPFTLSETLNGGQAFRWNEVESGSGIWQGQWGCCVIQVSLDEKQTLQWRTLSEMEAAPATIRTWVEDYFNVSRDWETITDSLPWRSDPVLARMIEALPGLRLLKQPLDETLFAFLCSSTKQIVQIKQMCELVAERFGERLPGGYAALPDWETLNRVDEEELRECKLGYRAKYIKQTAEVIAATPHILNSIENADYEEAKRMLLTFPGVGEKIADCVLLFGAGKMEAFPVDTWIAKAMSRLYQLEGWKVPQIAHFGRVHYGEFAGYAQQLLFSGERVLK